MNDVDKLMTRREAIISTWRTLTGSARAARLPELEEHALHHQRMLEEPPTKEGLGDWIANLTKAVGIPPCDECKKRQAALNALDTTKPAAELARDVFNAILHPT